MAEKLNLEEGRFYNLIDGDKEIPMCFAGKLNILGGRYEFINRGLPSEDYEVINCINVPANSIYLDNNSKLRIKTPVVNLDDDNFPIDNLPNLSYRSSHSEFWETELFLILNRKLENAERKQKRKRLINKLFKIN